MDGSGYCCIYKVLPLHSKAALASRRRCPVLADSYVRGSFHQQKQVARLPSLSPGAAVYSGVLPPTNNNDVVAGAEGAAMPK
jgi:hypothetical protein